MDENYFFEYNDSPLIIFENIILNKHGDVHLIYQNLNKEIILFIGNKERRNYEKFLEIIKRWKDNCYANLFFKSDKTIQIS
jgi:hypothetical protein